MYYLTVSVGLGSLCSSAGSSGWRPLASLQARSWPWPLPHPRARWEESSSMLACLVLAGFISLWSFGLRVSGAHWLLFFQYISNTGAHLCFQRSCWVICAEATTAEKSIWRHLLSGWTMPSILCFLASPQGSSYHGTLIYQCKRVRRARDRAPQI